MAELVGIFAASHGPMIAREWERLSPDVRGRIETGFDEVGRRLKASRPDVLIIVSPGADEEPGTAKPAASAKQGAPK